MFTGLVEEVGTVTRIEAVPHGSRLAVASDTVAGSLSLGDSVAVDGVCLTAIAIEGNEFIAEVSPETIARTNLSFFQIGTRVNLERPLLAGSRLGGHFVQGHVDAIVRQRALQHEGDFVRMGFTIPRGLRQFLVPKGSIAINGVSLTVADLDDDGFDVQLVPHTLEHTNLTAAERAEALNVEVDVLGKYVARMLEGYLEAAGPPAAAEEAPDDGIVAGARFVEPAGEGR